MVEITYFIIDKDVADLVSDGLVAALTGNRVSLRRILDHRNMLTCVEEIHKKAAFGLSEMYFNDPENGKKVADALRSTIINYQILSNYGEISKDEAWEIISEIERDLELIGIN